MTSRRSRRLGGRRINYGWALQWCKLTRRQRARFERKFNAQRRALKLRMRDLNDEPRCFGDGSPMYYGRDGHPISLRQWAFLFELRLNQVAFTRLPGHTVSTIWLGLDHGFGGPPLIFEQVVFELRNGDRHNVSQDRFETEAEALEEHDKTVRRLLAEQRRARFRLFAAALDELDCGIEAPQ